ncbi:acyl-CoA ligase (AMP-forming), exosortase A system-associated [Altericroceibacterium spongiae]|uniref:Acyl-CoA ligase (AMP-forming), exosortase A system-associated n=1 Tax=Altericroceibacterium spongiae TaxID=2320269 RepID=A0A420ERB5_9SPHN|nr:acyl-CoA ligase (AMP-forming), exosortase A system-associated [Altericroceibacterium spongiae]RKF23236.1 acyl-CoA ligase (AMP-forming), exosortase A system-associated [Altericroceibacterium spongiae]
MPVSLDPIPVPLDHCVLSGHDDDTALILRDQTLSYKTLRLRVAQLASWLASQLPEKGARVASWGAKDLVTCLMPLAAARAGLVHIPINPLLKHTQVAHILADSGAQLLLGTNSRLDTLESEDIPSTCRIVDVAGIPGELDGEGLPLSTVDPQDLAAILYTSGSTGKPKGVMLSHANMWLGAVSVAHYLGLESDDVVLAVLPLSFDYGQNQLLSAWRAGAAVAPLDYLMPRDVIKACVRNGVTTLAAVPPLWVQLTEQSWPDAAIHSMRRLTNSGGPLTLDLISNLRSIFPQADIFPMYGLTEAFRSTYLDPKLVADHPASMGRAVPFAEILVINDDGEVAEPEEEGELVHCGPLVAQGYWQDAERTSDRFRSAPAESHYGGIAVWSGDRVKRDKQGLLYFVGRRDAMIKCSGVRISPQEVEDAALASGLVAEAVALGVAEKRVGQVVHLVARALGDRERAEKALPAILAHDLPNFMNPRVIHWRDTMPLNPNGKIDRVKLAREIEA